MAKPAILAATFVVLFTLAAAYDFQTLFATSTIFAKQNEQGTKCQKQIQRQLQLHSCQQHLRKSTKMSQSSMMVNQGSSWREEFPRCWQQLKQIHKECRCTVHGNNIGDLMSFYQNVQKVLEQLRQESEQGEMQGIEMREMLQTAQSLPNLCRLKPQCCAVPSGSY